MKSIKKSLAILLAAITLFSSFAVVFASAENNGKTVTNVQVAAPVIGEKSDEITVKTDDERYVPGSSVSVYEENHIMEIEKFYNLYKTYGHIITPEEYVEIYLSNLNAVNEASKEYKYYKAVMSAIIRLFNTGIIWTEYEMKDVEFYEEFSKNYLENYDAEQKNEFIGAVVIQVLLHSSSEYGLSFEDTLGEKAKGRSSTARIMQPGDTFKEGKSYMCWCAIETDAKKEINNLLKAQEALIPYCNKKAETEKKLETASEEEKAALNNQLESLKTEYKAELDDYEAKKESVEYALSYDYMPDFTINGEKAAFLGYSLQCYGYGYDFGEAEEAPKKMTFIEKVIAFFERILDFFRRIFGSFTRLKND